MEKYNINCLFDQLKQDEKSDIRVLELINGNTSFLIAELKAGKTLPAHYHNEGSEIYHILAGKGKMEIGVLSGSDVIWNECFEIIPEDVFEINSKVVHRLSNDGDENLKIVFITPPSHLGNDRFFI